MVRHFLIREAEVNSYNESYSSFGGQARVKVFQGSELTLSSEFGSESEVYDRRPRKKTKANPTIKYCCMHSFDVSCAPEYSAVSRNVSFVMLL